MHDSSLLRMQWFVKTYLVPLQKPGLKVLDVGSYDVNGSYRQFFPEPDFLYTGLDMGAGPNVDVAVETPYYWPMLADESFDVVISGQAFEHIEFFWFTLEEMIRVAKKNALFCIIAPRSHPRHRYPTDTYRFDEDGMVALARYGNLKPLHVSMNLAPPPPIWRQRCGITRISAMPCWWPKNRKHGPAWRIRVHINTFRWICKACMVDLFL